MVSRTIVSVLLTVLLLGTAAIGKEAAETLTTDVYAVKVVSPNGGEKWDENSSQSILWEMSSAAIPDSIRIKLIRKAVKGDAAISKIDRVLATIYKVNPGKWEWVNVGPTGEGLKIQVEAFYPKKKVVKDVSDDFFIIIEAATPFVPPAVSVLSPNGGEVWKVGSKEMVKWNLEGIKPSDLSRPDATLMFTIGLSRDGGETYEILVSGLSVTASDWEWTLPNAVSDKCRLKVTLLDKESAELCKDVSNTDFRIIPNDMGQQHNEGTGH